jgi:acyl carrier protein
MSESAERERVLESIYAVLPGILTATCADGPELSDKTRLMEDLGMTSVATLELMLGLEDILDIQIDVEEIQPDDVACLGALADFIAAQMAVAD